MFKIKIDTDKFYGLAQTTCNDVMKPAIEKITNTFTTTAGTADEALKALKTTADVALQAIGDGANQTSGFIDQASSSIGKIKTYVGWSFGVQIASSTIANVSSAVSSVVGVMAFKKVCENAAVQISKVGPEAGRVCREVANTAEKFPGQIDQVVGTFDRIADTFEGARKDIKEVADGFASRIATASEGVLQNLGNLAGVCAAGYLYQIRGTDVLSWTVSTVAYCVAGISTVRLIYKGTNTVMRNSPSTKQHQIDAEELKEHQARWERMDVSDMEKRQLLKKIQNITLG